jgi:hypothetical protein
MRFDEPSFVPTPFEPEKHFWCQGKALLNLSYKAENRVKWQRYGIEVCRSDSTRAEGCPNVAKGNSEFWKHTFAMNAKQHCPKRHSPH